jgi:1,4-dihydroxy-2-naphthoyl-CoA hydrolase
MSDRPPPQGFSAFIKLQFEEVSGELVRGVIDIGPEHLQPYGIVHGGLFTAAVEEAASYGASVAVSERGQSVVGVANSTEFLRPMTEGRVQVQAVPLHQGRVQQLWEVRISRLPDGALMAIGRLRLQNLAAPPRT